jgi:periplasmic divalent cation tolerance protein
MAKPKQFCVVFVTCGTLTEGRRIARKLIGKRIAACVNVVLSPVESFYTWKGNVGRTREFLLVIKTREKHMTALEMEVKRLHRYDVPELIALPIIAGSAEYLAWLGECTKK